MSELPRGCVVGNRFVIDGDGPIAEGTYAHVYRAKDNSDNGRLVAVKVEAPPYSGNRSLLRAEANVLRFLQRLPGIPQYIDFREQDEAAGGSLVAMELLGEDLGITLGRLRRLSSQATAFLGLQMLRTIRAVHEKGLVHRDIKPNNFIFGRGGRRLLVYLVDFGLGRRHLTRERNPRPPRAKCEFRGTTRYASAAAHQGRDQGRVDDLWSLIFTLMELSAGSLPWNFYRSQARLGPEEKSQAKKRVLEEKLKLMAAVRLRERPPGFLRSIAQPMVDFIRVIDRLDYADVPDYDRLVTLLRSIGTEEERVQAAKRELPAPDAISALCIRHQMKPRLVVAPATLKVSLKTPKVGTLKGGPKKRRLPTEEATTADTRDSKKTRQDAAVGLGRGQSLPVRGSSSSQTTPAGPPSPLVVDPG